MFWKTPEPTHRRRRARRQVPRDLSDHLMRDLGLDPWPEEPPRPPRGW